LSSKDATKQPCPLFSMFNLTVLYYIQRIRVFGDTDWD
jgi:hypothetical protein